MNYLRNLAFCYILRSHFGAKTTPALATEYSDVGCCRTWMVELTFSWRRSNASCDVSSYRRDTKEARLMPQFRQEVEIEFFRTLALNVLFARTIS